MIKHKISNKYINIYNSSQPIIHSPFGEPTPNPVVSSSTTYHIPLRLLSGSSTSTTYSKAPARLAGQTGGFTHTPLKLRRVKVASPAFTIVELLVVIVVIGTLAAITIVAYTGISGRAVTASLQSDLSNAKKQLALYNVDHGAFPTSVPNNTGNTYCPVDDTQYCFKASSGNVLTYSPTTTTNPQSFTLVNKHTASDTRYSITNNSAPELFSSNWIAGIAGTALANKWVYNADISSMKAWGSNPSTLASPQGSIGLDAAPYDTYMAFVSDNNIDFAVFPARKACKDLGGRLPNRNELLAIYVGKSSYADNFVLTGSYWTALEYNSNYAWTVYFNNGSTLGSGEDKSWVKNVRCIAG